MCYNDRSVVSLIVNYGNSDAAMIKCESSRLLAGLIKNGLGHKKGEDGSHETDANDLVDTMVNSGGLAVVTATLVSTPHFRMANEALVAMSVLAAASPAELGAHRHLQTDLVINGCKMWLRKDDAPAEVKRNAFTLISQLLLKNTRDFAQMLNDLEFSQAVLETMEAKAADGQPALGQAGLEEAQKLLHKIRQADNN